MSLELYLLNTGLICSVAVIGCNKVVLISRPKFLPPLPAQGSLYFPGGAKRVEGQYKNDKRDGTWRHYREDGQMKQEDHYEKGGLVRWEQWDASGESKKIGAWE